MKLNVIQRNDWLFSNELCKTHEYHLLLICKKLRTQREKLVPGFSHIYPYLIELDQLMNSMNVDLIKTFRLHAEQYAM